MTFYITQNDTLPAFEVEVVDTSPQPKSMVDATARFHMWDLRTKQVKVDASATITDATARVVTYSWQSGDTDTVGDFEAEIQITYSDGGIRTFPTRTKIPVVITGEIS